MKRIALVVAVLMGLLAYSRTYTCSPATGGAPSLLASQSMIRVSRYG